MTLESTIGLDFIPDGSGDLNTSFGPEDVFYYIYATLHSPAYRRRYANFLKADFPRIPLISNRLLFIYLIRCGTRLTRLHLMETESVHIQTVFPAKGSNRVGRVRYTPPTGRIPGRVWINQKQYFENVVPETWDFTIGAYRPAYKWLKDRKGRTLSEDDIDHYTEIIAVLCETQYLMDDIDTVIEQHGGWPEAFQKSETLTVTSKVIPFRPHTVEPKPSERYINCAPLVPLRVAAGGFSRQQYVEGESCEWVRVHSRYRLRPGMFVAQVVGKSMEPTIPDGAYCLFRAPVEGTRQGKTVLVELRDDVDPETGHRYTVKRYDSQKAKVGDSWRHTRITLKPNNPDFGPIVLTGADEGELQVIAELIEVLTPTTPAGER